MQPTYTTSAAQATSIARAFGYLTALLSLMLLAPGETWAQPQRWEGSETTEGAIHRSGHVGLEGDAARLGVGLLSSEMGYPGLHVRTRLAKIILNDQRRSEGAQGFATTIDWRMNDKPMALMGTVGNSERERLGSFWISVDGESESPWSDGHFVIAANENVGIGTTSPETPLDVAGSVRSRGPSYGVQLKGDHESGPQIKFLDLGGADYMKIGAYDNVNNVELKEGRDLAITGANVGIGTASPEKRLTVSGTIGATEVVVKSDWADFVFEEGYRLRALTEVAAYAQEHGHLPGIPSAEEVGREGVRLGQMEAKLLQKIEELTLYAIEQLLRRVEASGLE